MPKPIKFEYKKKAPYRDASFFIIVCEGENREYDYFKFFDGVSSRVKIVPVRNEDGKSTPKDMAARAIAKEEELQATDKNDRTWFVIDTDKWAKQIHELRKECETRSHWKVAQSNPCFEVWLYFHAKAQLPALEHIGHCNSWKPHLPQVIQGGFNPDFHPASIEIAIENSKKSYAEKGYSPTPGSTELWRLGEELLPLIRKSLDEIKHRYPAPVVIG